jgi:probable rRNA maturation factor
LNTRAKKQESKKTTMLISKSVKSIGLSQSIVKAVIETTLKTVCRHKADLSVHFIGDHKMRSLNRDYRSIDRTTDVLAFAMQEGEVFDKVDLGDIFISVPQIKRQAKKLGVSFQEELSRMLVHGILHLCGYDHIKKNDYKIMIPLQEKILRTVISK